jgi:eukaryotic-like serine/threonine-protein kinase
MCTVSASVFNNTQQSTMLDHASREIDDRAAERRFLADVRVEAASGHELRASEQPAGEDLALTLALDGPLRWTRVLTIARQICQALIPAHQRGLVHGDIRPGNCIRCVRDGALDHIQLQGFGAVDPRHGSPGYMAGELRRGEDYDHRVDLYALGVVMYQLLTDDLPYPDADTTPVPMRRTLPTLEISPGFEALVLRAIAADRGQRFADTRAMLAALEEAEPTSARAAALSRDPLSWDFFDDEMPVDHAVST